jgi:hypothetical protein
MWRILFRIFVMNIMQDPDGLIQSLFNVLKLFKYKIDMIQLTLLKGTICTQVKGKIVPVLNGFKHYAMKAYGGVDI